MGHSPPLLLQQSMSGQISKLFFSSQIFWYQNLFDVWWLMPVTTLRRLRQDCHRLDASLSYRGRPYLKTEEQNKIFKIYFMSLKKPHFFIVSIKLDISYGNLKEKENKTWVWQVSLAVLLPIIFFYDRPDFIIFLYQKFICPSLKTIRGYH